MEVVEEEVLVDTNKITIRGVVPTITIT